MYGCYSHKGISKCLLSFIGVFLVILLIYLNSQLKVLNTTSLRIPLDSRSFKRHPVPPCPKKVFGGNFPPTALISYPGSGNTWLRHLIETATVFYTGSVYYDSDLFKKGFQGENLTVTHFRKLIAVKLHKFYVKYTNEFTNSIVFSKESKCLILIRNPFDAYLAEFSRYYSNSHVEIPNFTSKGFLKKFHTEKLVSQIYTKKLWYHTYMDSYRSCMFNKSGSNKKKSLHFVLYENLKTNLVEKLKRILIYFQEYDEKRFKECVLAQPPSLEGLFRRKKTFSKIYFYS